MTCNKIRARRQSWLRLVGSLTVTSLLSAGVALAAPGGAHGSGGLGSGGGLSGATNPGGFGGQSAGHMDSAGMRNGNGANAIDRDFGRDRANDRAPVRDVRDMGDRSDIDRRNPTVHHRNSMMHHRGWRRHHHLSE